MTSWRERLCGSVAVKDDDVNEATIQHLDQVLKSNQNLSHGGGFLMTKNPAHQQTTQSVILPTEKYAVMILKSNGHAVIYSDDENIVGSKDEDEIDDDDLVSYDFNE